VPQAVLYLHAYMLCHVSTSVPAPAAQCLSCRALLLKRTLLPEAGTRPAGRRRDNKVLGAPLRIGEACTFHSFRTNNYKLHFLESPSGLKVQASFPSKLAHSPLTRPLSPNGPGHVGPRLC